MTRFRQAVEDRGRIVAGGTVAGISLLLLLVPLYDVWDDTRNLGWQTSQTFAENSILLALTLGLFAAGVWLANREWEPRDALTVAAWTAGGAVSATAVFAWIIGFQLLVMNTLKPYVLAFDGVLVASIAAFGIGVVAVRRNQSRRALEREHERVTALFEDANDSVISVRDAVAADHASLRLDGGRIVVTDTNSQFERDFDASPETVLQDAESADDDGRYDFGALCDHVLDGDRYGARIRVGEGDDARYFRLRTVPAGEGNAFVVLTDVTDQTVRSERLEREKTERERELERRTEQLEFLHSLLRHDVQNGMMVVKSRAEVMADEIDDAELVEYARTIESRSEEISDQVDRMRTALQAITGEARETETIDAGRAVADQIDAARTSFPSASFAVDVGDGDVRVEADEILKDVIGNLLENAVVHNDEDVPEVEATVRRHDEDVRIEVADNGPGIDPEHRDAVFRRGATTTQVDHESGSGFGLFFVDTIVEGYGGEVWIEGNEPVGCRVVVELPAAEGATDD